ncbi:MAG: hypothetical protein ACQESK_06050 [Bacteroidota bacterium]
MFLAITRFKNKKFNELLILFALLIAVPLIYAYFEGFENINPRENFSMNSSFYYFVVYTILIGPLLEEFLFRGVFIESKIAKGLSVVLVNVFLIYFENLLSLILLAVFDLIVLFFFLRPKATKRILIYSTIFMFAYSHYTINDLSSLNGFFYSFFHLSVTFLFTWVILNYNYTVSVFVHSVFNSIIIAIFSFGLNSIDGQINKIENSQFQGYYITKFHKEKPNTDEYRVTKDSVICKNCKPEKLYKVFSNSATNKEKIITVYPTYIYHDIFIESKTVDFSKDQDNLEWMFEYELLKKKDSE